MTHSDSRVAASHHSPAPLPITIVPGMQVVDLRDAATIVGFTQGYCIHRGHDSTCLAVSSWRDLAVGGICPASALLPGEPAERDRENWSATTLRELLGLQPFGLSTAQQSALDELVQRLCCDL